MASVSVHFSFDFEYLIADNWVQLLEIVWEQILDHAKRKKSRA